MAPEPLRFDNVPPLTVTLDLVKVVEGSDSEKLIVATCPAIRELVLEVRKIVGRMRSVTGAVDALLTCSFVPKKSV